MDQDSRNLFSRDCYVSVSGRSSVGRVEITGKRLMVLKLSMQIFGLSTPHWEIVLDVDINEDINLDVGRKRSIFLTAQGKKLLLPTGTSAAQAFRRRSKGT